LETLGSQPITLSEDNLSLEEGFTAIIKQARPLIPLKLVSHQDIYIIVVPENIVGLSRNPDTSCLSFRLRDAKMDDALFALCNASGISLIDGVRPRGSVTLKKKYYSASGAFLEILSKATPSATLLIDPSLITIIPATPRHVSPFSPIAIPPDTVKP